MAQASLDPKLLGWWFRIIGFKNHGLGSNFWGLGSRGSWFRIQGVPEPMIYLSQGLSLIALIWKFGLRDRGYSPPGAGGSCWLAALSLESCEQKVVQCPNNKDQAISVVFGCSCFVGSHRHSTFYMNFGLIARRVQGCKRPLQHMLVEH